MGRRSRRRREQAPDDAGGTTSYEDADGNVLELRNRLSAGTLRQLRELAVSAGSSQEDRWQRREELLFERFTVAWTIAGLPLTRQKELLGRYRMADSDTRRWVRQTLEEHLRARHPEAAG